MRYLLDTHVILWIAFERQKLSKRAEEIFVSDVSELYISAISFWEICLKYQSGKLSLGSLTPDSFYKVFKENFQTRELELTTEDVVSSHNLEPVHHKDPFDRMLIWQCLQNKLAFVSDDNLIKQYTDSGLKVIW